MNCAVDFRFPAKALIFFPSLPVQIWPKSCSVKSIVRMCSSTSEINTKQTNVVESTFS